MTVLKSLGSRDCLDGWIDDLRDGFTRTLVQTGIGDGMRQCERTAAGGHLRIRKGMQAEVIAELVLP